MPQQKVHSVGLINPRLGLSGALDAGALVGNLPPGLGVSVALTMPSIFSVSGSPADAGGTLAVSLATQTANKVFAGPASGGALAPTFRSLVPADYPVFIASGASHAVGAVPDPGSSSGTTKFLREDASWAVTNPLSAKGDLFTYSTVGAKLGVGSDGQVLGADSTQDTGLKWVTPYANPLTTKGDLVAYTTTTTKLAVGTANKQVLTVDSAQATGLKYALPNNQLFDTFVDAGNADTTEVDLITNTLAASTLASNGDKVEGNYIGTFANNATTKRIKVYFAETAIYDSTPLTVTAAGDWWVEVLLIRVSSTVVRCSVKVLYEASGIPDDVAYVELTGLTLSGTNILKVTGTAGAGAAANDIVGSVGVVGILPAA